MSATASEPPLWLSAGVALASIAGAILAAKSAGAASSQAKSAEKASVEAQKQATLAKAQLQELQRQNNIALHTHRLQAYESFLRFRSELNMKVHGFAKSELWSFYAQARLSDFYFPPPVARAMQKIVDDGIEISALHDRIIDPQGASTDETREVRAQARQLVTSLLSAMDDLEKDMRGVMQLQRPGA